MGIANQQLADSSPSVTLTVGQLRAIIREEVHGALCSGGVQLAAETHSAPSTAKPFLTVREAAEMSRLAPSTVRLYIRKGHLNIRKIGRRVIIARAELERFLGSPSKVVELYSA